jgi:hypothetical protein
MKATEIPTIVTISTIGANWALKGWNKFRIAVKTFQAPDWLILSLSFCSLPVGESLKQIQQQSSCSFWGLVGDVGVQCAVSCQTPLDITVLPNFCH